ncbi:MAG: DUF5916 domain-containing protein [Acidobacteriota bacterium]|nr:DUF5916 domain-containing protein [Acidobacteriota bacterium]
MYCPRGVRSPILVIAGLGLAPFGAADAQVAPPELRAHRFAVPPAIDGEVISESVWQALEVATNFVQLQPFEGEPATERTEVRIGFDDTTLYIGVVCYDSEPSALAISDSRRDAQLEEEDSFRVVLDTYHDRQNGLIFGTNVGGIQYDGQMTNQGRGQTPSIGSSGPTRGGSANLDWDTSWNVATRTSDIGWSAELAIPFRSLRYGSSATWGMNFERNIRRKSETSFWAPLGREFDLFRVSEAGVLVGLEAPNRRSLQVVPYALTSTRDDGVTERKTDVEGGFDVKYGITPSLTLDGTFKTDFAQVEVDDQQINLDRFSLFFPEKRPFFLENAGYFTVGTTGPRFPGSGFVDLFFSRRIGLDEGEQVPIRAGVRVSGKAAGLNVGFLDMQTEELGDLHANNFAVGRLSREFGKRGRAGLIALNRQGTGSAPDDDYNRTYGIDGQIGIGRYADLSGFIANTSTPGREGHDHAFALEVGQESPRWRNRASYSEVGEDFNPEVGFVNRSNYRRFTGSFGHRIRPKGSRIQEWGPRFFFDDYRDFDGFQETGRYSFGGEVQTRSGAGVTLFVGNTREGVREPFELFPGVIVPAGTHRSKSPYYFMFFNSNRGRAISLGGRIQAGGFFDGEQLSINPTLNLRMGDYLSSELGWSYNDVELSGGDFNAQLGRLRLTYAFSTEILLQALIQYNDVNNDVSTNLRFSWLGAANTGLFLVYNEVSEFGAMAALEPDRSLILKYSRLIEVFR